MDYSPPKTLLNFSNIKFSKTIHSTWRLGNFVILPINDSSNSEHYWITSCFEDGKYTTSYYHDLKNRVYSPKFNTEEKAIRWLEKALVKLSNTKIKQENSKLLKQIKKNNKFLERFKHV